MKTFLLFLAGLTLAASASFAQNVTVNPGAGSYPTLKAAFDAINAGTHTGAVTVSVDASTVETATAALNASGVGAASYTSVTVTPSVPVTVTGAIVGAVIKLVGADFVTIDGRIAGAGRNLTVSNTSNTTATAAIWVTSTGVGAGATNNVIRNLEIACGAPQNTGILQTMGILMASNNTAISLTSNSDDCDNNSFIANRIIKCRHGIVTRGTTTNLSLNTVVTDNIVGPTAFGSDEIGHTGILMQADQGATVSRNTVQFVGGDFANTTGGADRIGIAIGSDSWSTTASTTLTSNTYTVTKNVIHDIVEDRTFSAVGINLATTGGGSPTNNLVANNFIYNMRANATAGDQLCGIGITGGHTDQVIFNSIALTGDQDVGAASLSTNFGQGIRISVANGATHANLTLADNSIYLDASCSTATTHYYAITGTSAAYSFGTGFENYNNVYINPANPQLRTGGLGTASGASTTTEFLTLANWQAAYTAPQDAASIQADPVYISNTSDLHISGASPNIDVGVDFAAVTDDIDAQFRPNGVSDIGADEFYALPGTLQFSSVTYGGNENTSPLITVTRTGGSSGVVTVDVTLADVSATGGAACGVGVDYVNPGVQTLTFGNNVTSQTFNVPLCADAVVDPGESLSMTLSNATGGANIGANNPATLNITDVPPPLSGSYNVPGDYPSLTNAGGIFATLNLAGASGNITINITADLVGETGANGLNGLAGGFTVLIRPTGAPRSITGSFAGALIRFIGASGVTVDGSLGPVSAPLVPTRDLTITNASATTPSVLLFGSVGGASAPDAPATTITGDTLKNCNIINGANSSSAVVISDATTLGNPGFFSNVTIQNNSIQKAFIGVYANGGTAPQGGSNLNYLDNDLNTSGANAIRFIGLYMQGVNGATVSGNDVGNFSSEDEDDKGIWFASGTINATANANSVSGLHYVGVGGYGNHGIAISTGQAGANILVSNNMIFDNSGDGFNYTGSFFADNPFGIYAFGTQTGVKIYANSINLFGNTLNQTNALSVGIALGTGTVADIQDNIIVNNLGLSAATGYGAAGIWLQSASSQLAVSNYNDFYVNPTGSGVKATGQIALAASLTLADWQTATTQEANSVAGDPLFASNTNLHITNSSVAANIGTPLASVPFDFDGDARSATIPDIGADEVPNAAPFTVSSALSRKTHGGAGDFDINLPFSAPFGVECRNTGGTETVIITFSNTLVSGTAAVTTGTGVAGAPVFSANTMTIPLTGVTDVQQIEITASNVMDVFAQVIPSTVVQMKVLIGDTNGSSGVSAGDVSQTKAQSGNPAGAGNFRTDVNASGGVSAADVSQVKSKSGNSLP